MVKKYPVTYISNHQGYSHYLMASMNGKKINFFIHVWTTKNKIQLIGVNIWPGKKWKPLIEKYFKGASHTTKRMTRPQMIKLIFSR